MGHSGSVSRLVTAAAKHPPTVQELKKLGKMLNLKKENNKGVSG
jgi:hypothetical protein